MFEKIADLHRLCFPHKPWSASDFADLKKSGCEIIASDNGFIVYRTILDQAEIITIGVHPDTRRAGIGAALLEIMERDVAKSGATQIFLEVASTNTAAHALYIAHGYRDVGRRPKYYDGIDAILMAKDIIPPTA